MQCPSPAARCGAFASSNSQPSPPRTGRQFARSSCGMPRRLRCLLSSFSDRSGSGRQTGYGSQGWRGSSSAIAPGEDDALPLTPASSPADREPTTRHFWCCVSPPLSLCLAIEAVTSMSRLLPPFTLFPFPSLCQRKMSDESFSHHSLCKAGPGGVGAVVHLSGGERDWC